MNARYEPGRLAEASAATDPLAAAIAALRAEPPNAAQIDALAQRLAPQLAAPTLAGTASAALAWWVKWLLGLSVSLAVGVMMNLAPALRGGASQVAPRSTPSVQAPRSARSISTPVATAPPAVSVAQSGAPDLEHAVTPARTRTPARRAARDAAEPAPAPPPERELVLLERSRAALDADPAVALELAEAHARSYPAGIFAQERELLAIEALLKLKRKTEAHARAERFVERYPESPHTRRVRGLLDHTPARPGSDSDREGHEPDQH